MKIWIISFVLLLLMGCQLNDDRNFGNREEGLEHTRMDGLQTNDEMLLESRREVEFIDDEVQTREAERLLMEYLQINNDKQVVQYDHKENGKYILQVYEADGYEQKPVEWYSVDMKTKEIEKLTR